MPTGKVKWFDPKKGYGFILGEQGQGRLVNGVDQDQLLAVGRESRIHTPTAQNLAYLQRYPA